MNQLKQCSDLTCPFKDKCKRFNEAAESKINHGVNIETGKAYCEYFIMKKK